jgi:hypothetical protein
LCEVLLDDGMLAVEAQGNHVTLCERSMYALQGDVILAVIDRKIPIQSLGPSHYCELPVGDGTCRDRRIFFAYYGEPGSPTK